MSGRATCAKMFVSVASIWASRAATTASGFVQSRAARSCGLPTTQRTRRGCGRGPSTSATSRIVAVIACHLPTTSTFTAAQPSGAENVSSNERTIRPPAARSV